MTRTLSIIGCSALSLLTFLPNAHAETLYQANDSYQNQAHDLSEKCYRKTISSRRGRGRGKVVRGYRSRM